jgi:AcrR family transcriptional regulator
MVERAISILIVRSVLLDDRSTPARIRDAALRRFAADGFDRATVRAIAADAEVSPGLVLHHFGSKEGLQTACDDYVVRRVTAEMEPWIDRHAERAAHPVSFTQVFADAADLVGYLGRALVETGPRTDDMVDRLVTAAEAFLADGEARGTIRSSADRRALAAVLVIWDLASIVLGAHLARALGETDQRTVIDRYARVALEMFSHGFINPREDT